MVLRLVVLINRRAIERAITITLDRIRNEMICRRKSELARWNGKTGHLALRTNGRWGRKLSNGDHGLAIWTRNFRPDKLSWSLWIRDPGEKSWRPSKIKQFSLGVRSNCANVKELRNFTLLMVLTIYQALLLMEVETVLTPRCIVT